MIFLTTGKGIRSIILGFAGFCGAFFSVSVNFPPLSVTILWSYFLPLLAGMAYGAKYALIAGILGLGAFFPFVLWPTNGWANGVTSILYLFLYAWFGYFASIRKRHPAAWNHPLVIGAPYVLFYFVTTVLLYPLALSFNPPYWETAAITSLPTAVLISIATKGAVLMGLIIVCNVGILKIPVARYLLGLPVPKESRLNGRIFGASLFGILGLWYIRLLFNHVFIDRNLPQGLFELIDPREFIGLVIFVGAGFFIGYIVSVNMELRLAAYQNLETANESLERRVAERTAELTAVHQELVAHYEEMRLSQEILRDTNLYIENLINYANAPIIVWDPQFTITRFNHAFEFMTGRSEAEVLGQSLNMLFPPEYEAESMRLIHKTLAGERWETVEIAILHRDGSIRTVLWNSATLFTPDTHKPIATIAQGNDITERKKLRQL
ncbi:MAG: PAS domain-containing protein [Negativicutes bacterium]